MQVQHFEVVQSFEPYIENNILYIPHTHTTYDFKPTVITETLSEDPIKISITTIAFNRPFSLIESNLYIVDPITLVIDKQAIYDDRFNKIKTQQDMVPSPYNTCLHSILDDKYVLYKGYCLWINNDASSELMVMTHPKIIIYIKLGEVWIETTLDFMARQYDTLPDSVADEWRLYQNTCQ